MKKILMILGILLTILAVGLVGNLDQDEYIEVNLQPKARMPFYYEN